MSELGRIIVYGVLAAASPTVLLVTLATLASGRGRVNGGIFATAFLFSQTMAFMVVFFLGTGISERSHETFADWLEMAAGVGLLVLVGVKRPGAGDGGVAISGRMEAQLDRLGSITPRVSLVAGLLLGVGAKRLVITALAAGTIAVSGEASATEVFLSIVYILTASVIVWAPVVVYLVLGRRSDELVRRARDWVTGHAAQVTYVSAIVIGVVFVLDAAVKLAS